MTDSVPAPMVQLPAEPGSVISAKPPGRKKAFLMALCDDGEWWVRLDNYGSFSERGPFREVRVLFDAATPAVSVPAADILALADEWENYDAEGYAAGDGPDWWTRTDQLRALVAAAEQADKGEAADTPRDEYDAHLGTTIAPAAPPEPLCRCGHTNPTHGWHANRPCNAHGCPCAQYEPRVPVNDEAEACNEFGRMVENLWSHRVGEHGWGKEDN